MKVIHADPLSLKQCRLGERGWLGLPKCKPSTPHRCLLPSGGPNRKHSDLWATNPNLENSDKCHEPWGGSYYCLLVLTTFRMAASLVCLWTGSATLFLAVAPVRCATNMWLSSETCRLPSLLRSCVCLFALCGGGKAGRKADLAPGVTPLCKW